MFLVSTLVALLLTQHRVNAAQTGDEYLHQVKTDILRHVYIARLQELRPLYSSSLNTGSLTYAVFQDKPVAMELLHDGQCPCSLVKVNNQNKAEIVLVRCDDTDEFRKVAGNDETLRKRAVLLVDDVINVEDIGLFGGVVSTWFNVARKAHAKMECVQDEWVKQELKRAGLETCDNDQYRVESQHSIPPESNGLVLYFGRWTGSLPGNVVPFWSAKDATDFGRVVRERLNASFSSVSHSISCQLCHLKP